MVEINKSRLFLLFLIYLGILIDQHVTWKHYIVLVVFKTTRTVGYNYVMQIVSLCSVKHLLVSHCTTIMSLWLVSLGPGACNSHLNKLLKLKKRTL